MSGKTSWVGPILSTFCLKFSLILQLFGSKQPTVTQCATSHDDLFSSSTEEYFQCISLRPAKVLRTKMQMDFQCFSQLCIDSLPRIFSTGQMKRKLDHMPISNGHQAFKKPKIQRNNKHFSIFSYSFTKNNIYLLDQRQILPFRNNCVCNEHIHATCKREW